MVADLQLHFGDEKSLTGKGAAPRMAGSLLMRGTQKHTRQQLQDEFDKIKARVNVNGSLTGASARIDTVRAGLIPALQLAAEILREPSFPESDFEQIRQASIAQLEAGRSEPQTMASIAMNRYLNASYPPGDPRHSLTIDENIDELKKVTLEEAKKFYTDFYGASNAELAVVGDFDAAEVRKVAEELFGSWKSPKPYSVVKRKLEEAQPRGRHARCAGQSQRDDLRGDHGRYGPAGPGLPGHGSGRPHHGRRREEQAVGPHPRKGRPELRSAKLLPRRSAGEVRFVCRRRFGQAGEHRQGGSRV